MKPRTRCEKVANFEVGRNPNNFRIRYKNQRPWFRALSTIKSFCAEMESWQESSPRISKRKKRATELFRLSTRARPPRVLDIVKSDDLTAVDANVSFTPTFWPQKYKPCAKKVYPVPGQGNWIVHSQGFGQVVGVLAHRSGFQVRDFQGAETGIEADAVETIIDVGPLLHCHDYVVYQVENQSYIGQIADVDHLSLQRKAEYRYKLFVNRILDVAPTLYEAAQLKLYTPSKFFLLDVSGKTPLIEFKIEDFVQNGDDATVFQIYKASNGLFHLKSWKRQEDTKSGVAPTEMKKLTKWPICECKETVLKKVAAGYIPVQVVDFDAQQGYTIKTQANDEATELCQEADLIPLKLSNKPLLLHVAEGEHSPTDSEDFVKL